MGLSYVVFKMAERLGGRGVLRVEFHGFLHGAQGGGVLPQFGEDEAQSVLCLGVLWVGGGAGEHLLQCVHGAVLLRKEHGVVHARYRAGGVAQHCAAVL